MDGRPTSEHAPFTDLPAALVEDLLGKTGEVADKLLEPIRRISGSREDLRQRLVSDGLLVGMSDLMSGEVPTTCAADGAYAVERLMATDLVCAAAVAVEGLSPPSEERHWDRPCHEGFVAAEPHVANTDTVLRAIMLGEELRLLEEAEHKLAMFDGSLSTPLAEFNLAFVRATETQELECSRRFLERCPDYLRAYRAVLRPTQSDRQCIGVPKQSTRRELGEKQEGWPDGISDRMMLSFLLDEGEMTAPRVMKTPGRLRIDALPEHIREQAEGVAKEIPGILENCRVFYLKPERWMPAVRVEISHVVALDAGRLGRVVRGVAHQMAAPAMLEPYPLYLADRTVKALSRALPAVRQVVTQKVSERYEHDIGDVLQALHSYRTEGGR